METQRDWTQVIKELESLRHLLCSPEAEDALSLFDEFLHEQEFGLALHAVCDFVRTSSLNSISPADLEGIRILHALMQIEDDCVLTLRKKLELETPGSRK